VAVIGLGIAYFTHHLSIWFWIAALLLALIFLGLRIFALSLRRSPGNSL
jgi:hypothetical protein